MKKQIEVSEELLAEANKVLSKANLNFEAAITMLWERIVEEQSVEFMCKKIKKNEALCLLTKQGCQLSSTITFASKNKSAYNYWANPKFDVLENNWSLILSDWIHKKLYLFHIPAKTIPKTRLTPRTDNNHEINLQIAYLDPTFTDNQSHFSFKPFFVKEFQY